ncbi:MAG: UvrD-helicase domain-containing protein [Negativicutes bacterium]|nr:UvrD-helicase domain-containing protein [Negativicutes bacterium]
MIWEQYFDKLNEQQRAAVMHEAGPVLVVAGAGSGKTSVLTCRIARLISDGVEPGRILAITFTNKAAGEMRDRVMKMVGPAGRQIWLSTFHAFCVRLLRREIEHLPTPTHTRQFVVYDADDSLAAIKKCINRLNLDVQRFAPGAVAGYISRLKNNLITVEQLLEECDRPAGASGAGFRRHVAEVYSLYQTMLRQANALDFDDLLMTVYRLFDRCRDVRERYQQFFRHILIDEYQDTNRVQYLIAKTLAAGHENIFVVGDVDQGIYSWRGADIQNLLMFEADWPQAKIIKLEQNYRSTSTILNAANAVIANNTRRREKKLWTANLSDRPIILFTAGNERQEADFIATVIQRSLQQGAGLGQFAVLYRMNAQSRAIEESLITRGIPYIIVGGLRFYERREIKDMLAYLRLVVNPDDDISLQRIINLPPRGIGTATWSKINQWAQTNGLPLFEALCQQREIGGLTASVRENIDTFCLGVISWHNRHQTVGLGELYDLVASQSGYEAYWREQKDSQTEQRLENLNELRGVIESFAAENPDAGLGDFLTHIALLSDIDDAETAGDRVVLMSLHAAKGLEFDNVFISGMEETIFPHRRAYGDDDALEEERRLFYVGITRARSSLYLTNCRSRGLFGRVSFNEPSRFISEIPDRYLRQLPSVVPAGQSGNPLFNSGGAGPAGRPLDNARAAVKIGLSVPGDEEFTPIPLGTRVQHRKFGDGTVIECSRQEIAVSFDQAGVRRLVPSLAKLRVTGEKI